MRLKFLGGLISFFLTCSALAVAQDGTPRREELVTFLLRAKTSTYASQSDEASVKSPLLPGTHQLEYTEGPFFYRDIYAGSALFAGQEIVYYRGKPVWTMSYAGNIPPEIPKEEVDALVALLHKALMRVPAEIPYRGPRDLQDGAYTYSNQPEGNLDSFFGRETIAHGEKVVYELRYGGGMVR